MAMANDLPEWKIEWEAREALARRSVWLVRAATPEEAERRFREAINQAEEGDWRLPPPIGIRPFGEHYSRNLVPPGPLTLNDVIDSDWGIEVITDKAEAPAAKPADTSDLDIPDPRVAMVADNGTELVARIEIAATLLRERMKASPATARDLGAILVLLADVEGSVRAMKIASDPIAVLGNLLSPRAVPRT